MGNGRQGKGIRCSYRACRAAPCFHRTKDLGEVGDGECQSAQHGELRDWQQAISRGGVWNRWVEHSWPTNCWKLLRRLRSRGFLKWKGLLVVRFRGQKRPHPT